MNIISNGSKWAGEAPDSFEELIEVLEDNKLDPRFLNYGKFFYKDGNDFIAWGNFAKLSHVFDIRGTLKELHPLALALKRNRQKYGIRLSKSNNTNNILN